MGEEKKSSLFANGLIKTFKSFMSNGSENVGKEKDIENSHQNSNITLLRKVLSKKLFYVFLVGFFGIIILNSSDIFQPPQQQNLSNNIQTVQEEEPKTTKQDALAQQLEGALKRIKGIGDKVEVTVYRREKDYNYVFDENITHRTTEESDNQGGDRNINEDVHDKRLAIIKKENGEEVPVKKTYVSEITGVLVTAEGAEDSRIEYEITKAVSNILQISIHQIEVFAHK
ncbi:MAG: hypothetical protein ACOCQR_01420 [bacterium]